MKIKISNSFILPAYLLMVGLSSAATYTWDPGNTANGTTIDPGNGTWNTTAGNIVWNNAGTNVIWAQTSATAALHEAVFGGVDGTYAVTVGQGIAAQRVLINNSGYTFSATSAQNITITANGSATSPGLVVASGKSVNIGNNVTMQNVSAGGSQTLYVGAATGGSGGTLNVESGGTLRSSNGNASLVLHGNGTTVNVKTGGNLSSGGSGAVTSSIFVGHDPTAGSRATVNVQGGNVTIANTGAAGLHVGGAGLGTVTLTSGSITVAGSLGVTFGRDVGATSGNNILNLDGGTLTTTLVRKGNQVGTNSIFNFNGGTLRASASSTTFMEGLNFANVKAGGAKIDTQANNITIGQNLLADSVSGGLTKSGSGTLTLTGTGSTYTGETIIKAGTLQVNTTTTLGTSSKITVGDTGSSGTILNASTAGLSIVSGQTLGGIGTVDVGSQSLAISGILAPGNSIGTLTALGDVTWNANHAWLFELGLASADLTSAASGSHNDFLNILGLGSDFNKGSGSAFTFDFANSGEVGFYKLVDWTGTSDFLSTDFVATNLTSGLSGTFIVDSGTSALYLNVIPEPSTALLGGLGMLALLRRRRA